MQFQFRDVVVIFFTQKLIEKKVLMLTFEVRKKQNLSSWPTPQKSVWCLSYFAPESDRLGDVSHWVSQITRLDISKIFCCLWYFTTVHKSMHIPLVSSYLTQKMDWKHGYLARSWYILVLAVLGRAGGWKLMQPC